MNEAVAEDIYRVESVVGPKSGKIDLMGIFLSSTEDCETEVRALHLNLTSATGGGWTSASEEGDTRSPNGFGLLPERYGVMDPNGGASVTVTVRRGDIVRCVIMQSCGECDAADFPRRTRVSFSEDSAWWTTVGEYDLPDPVPLQKRIMLRRAHP